MTGTEEIEFRPNANPAGIENVTTVRTRRSADGPVGPETDFAAEGTGELLTLQLLEFFAGYKSEVALMSAPASYRH